MSAAPAELQDDPKGSEPMAPQPREAPCLLTRLKSWWNTRKDYDDSTFEDWL